jgi:hypothetical protein
MGVLYLDCGKREREREKERERVPRPRMHHAFLRNKIPNK